jgi:ketosteroid isomerase-like protein
MRKFRLPFVLLLLIAGFFGWRSLQPKLSDEQQIAANLEAICAAASARNPRGVADFLAKDFKAGPLSKSEFQNAFATGIMQYRVVDLGVSGVQNQVQGENATSAGRFNLSLKFEHNSQPERKSGKFNLKWQKIDGEWKIVSADVPSLGQFGG